MTVIGPTGTHDVAPAVNVALRLPAEVSGQKPSAVYDVRMDPAAMREQVGPTTSRPVRSRHTTTDQSAVPASATSSCSRNHTSYDEMARKATTPGSGALAIA